MSQETTPLHSEHLALHAKMGEFAGWDMPLYYGSQIEEHNRVRQDAGMFDVSHMNVVDIKGPGARDYLRYMIANDVDKLKVVERLCMAVCSLKMVGLLMILLSIVLLSKITVWLLMRGLMIKM